MVLPGWAKPSWVCLAIRTLMGCWLSRTQLTEQNPAGCAEQNPVDWAEPCWVCWAEPSWLSRTLLGVLTEQNPVDWAESCWACWLSRTQLTEQNPAGHVDWAEPSWLSRTLLGMLTEQNPGCLDTHHKLQWWWAGGQGEGGRLRERPGVPGRG